MTAMPPSCRHCSRRRARRPRGLCFPCYYAPAVRDLYPPGSANPATAKYAPHRPSSFPEPFIADPPLPVPTAHPPGTPGKVAEMAGRAARGESLFHPMDRRP